MPRLEELPRFIRPERSARLQALFESQQIRLLSTSPSGRISEKEKKQKRKCFKKFSPFIYIALVFAAIAIIVYLSLVAVLVKRLTPPLQGNGLEELVKNWKEPSRPDANDFIWPADFSRDIIPKPCHSHNDYSRHVPLYDALASGCVGVEADVWLENGDLLVAHTRREIRPSRTLKSLYINPLVNILTHQNEPNQFQNTTFTGVYDTSPETSLILMLDFKSDEKALWPVVMKQLEPLRSRGWLTHYDGSGIVNRPITVVVSGNAKLEQVNSNQYRDIFLDAPLDSLASGLYTSANSYYASVSISQAIGTVWFGKLSNKQEDIIKAQIKLAQEAGLKSRYWGTPTWPVSSKIYIWQKLTDFGIGMLNVDDVEVATRWDWNWCGAAGLALC